MGILFTIEEDPHGRKGKTYHGRAGSIESQLDLLNFYKNDGRVPSADLLWEIKLYEFILNQADKEEAAKRYFDARVTFEPEFSRRSKREVAEFLGWVIV